MECWQDRYITENKIGFMCWDEQDNYIDCFSTIQEARDFIKFYFEGINTKYGN